MVYVYGGSFNPPTLAHKRIIETLLEQNPKDEVIVIPVGNDYKKIGLIDVKHRLEMLKRTVFGMSRVKISDIEIDKTYQGTLASLDKLSETYNDLSYVIGSDQLSDIKTWISYESLLEKYPFVIMMRNNMHPDDAEYLVKGLTHHFSYIQFDYPIASTDIRMKKNGYEKHLDPEVLAYIKENNLYKE